MINAVQRSFLVIILSVVILSLSWLELSAQDQKEKGLIKHAVQPLETFYSLSKKYGVTIDEIKKANPGVDYPKTGTYLNIPVDSGVLMPEFIIYSSQEAISVYTLARMLKYPVDSLRKWNPGIPSYLTPGLAIKTSPAMADVQTITHKIVEERSSLRDLSQLYDLPYKSLKDANPQIKNRVWYGQTVYIPVMEQGAQPYERIEVTGEIPYEREDMEEEEGLPLDCEKDPDNLDAIYKVALLVPFTLEEVRAIDIMVKASPSATMDKIPFRFIQFYQGFLMASDRLEKRGLKLQLAVYDADQDIGKIQDILHRPEMKEMDLIIGPFYKNTFSMAAEFSLRHEIPIVNPLSAREDILGGNPNVFKVLPSIPAQVDILTKLAYSRFSDHNFIVVRENKYQGTEFVGSVRKSLKEILYKEVPEVDYMTDSIAGVQQYLSDSLPNIVLVYAESEVLPVEILPLLYELNKELDVKVFGLPDWGRFEQLEYKYLIDLQAYLFFAEYIDYQDPMVKDFIEEFRATYHAEPMDYAYDGFDIAYCFLSLMMDYGRQFQDCLGSMDYQLLQNSFWFQKTPEGGYENHSWNVCRFSGYSLVRLPLGR